MKSLILHYRRLRKDYAGWGLHMWGPTVSNVSWWKPLLPSGEDDYGIYWKVELDDATQELFFILHRGNQKDRPEDQHLDLTKVGNEVWLIEGGGADERFDNPQDALQALLRKSVGDIKGKAQAYWLTSEIIAWHIGFVPRAIYKLHYSVDGLLKVTSDGISGGREVPLIFVDDRLSPELAEKYPHLKDAAMLKIYPKYQERIAEILKSQIAVSVASPIEKFWAATSLQIPGVLDDLYRYDGPLGVTFEGDVPVLRLWAPTAKSVKLHLFADSNPQTQSTVMPMTWDQKTGVWSVRGAPEWYGCYYLYEVEVFVRQEGCFVKNLVTDPYSVSLTRNSLRSQIINLEDPAFMPDEWLSFCEELRSQDSEERHPCDRVIYELHVRDFSVNDPCIPQHHRGMYLAFTHFEAFGMKHLRCLAEAGVTHVQLLPVFDFASVNEDKSEWVELNFDKLASYPPDSDKQQEMVAEIQQVDGYNWGYDPLHYFAPEGSYAVNPEGGWRLYEFRQMVIALGKIGLRVIMDVVFNHTYAAGQHEKSVLDKIVPGYYYRLDSEGEIITTTCCPNTASEHFMMEKLMVDSVLSWVKHYRIDGFRFDLMGHHMKTNMLRIRQALDSLTLERDGINGKNVYCYGEGWSFGEVTNNARGINASQWNMQGSGIGTFNDRLRSAIRGGGPFGDPWEQGFVTGLFTDPNEMEILTKEEQLVRLLELCDRMMVSLAGNLVNYEIVSGRGERLLGSQIGHGYFGGYTQNPQENVAYVSAHDNETWFDAIQLKAPYASGIEERVRMHKLGLSMIALCQGVPFFHAGCEILRSKSLDRDSYNSGDWFNKIDYSYQTNNWGIGLPLKAINGAYWPIMKRLLERDDIVPKTEHIISTLKHFVEMLQIRMSSPLFRLRTAQEILDRVHFHNTGPKQIPGLIVMSIVDIEKRKLDDQYTLIVVVFNARKENTSFAFTDFPTKQLTLHPILMKSHDLLVRTSFFDTDKGVLTVPGRTAAVFVAK